ncbi:hypothetical protein BSKO_09157 [Bryopsis sp. KO-2023]|nr:hypothetical protein BSKO_09157 [Bryopsis sp. KO-2023]
MGGIRRPSGCISHVVQVAARKQIPEILLRARFAVQIGGASFSWCVVWSLRELGKSECAMGTGVARGGLGALASQKIAVKKKNGFLSQRNALSNRRFGRIYFWSPKVATLAAPVVTGRRNRAPLVGPGLRRFILGSG